MYHFMKPFNMITSLLTVLVASYKDCSSESEFEFRILIQNPNLNSESGYWIQILIRILNPDSEFKFWIRIWIQNPNSKSESGFKIRIQNPNQNSDSQFWNLGFWLVIANLLAAAYTHELRVIFFVLFIKPTCDVL
jgi:hypothetical protein